MGWLDSMFSSAGAAGAAPAAGVSTQPGWLGFIQTPEFQGLGQGLLAASSQGRSVGEGLSLGAQYGQKLKQQKLQEGLLAAQVGDLKRKQTESAAKAQQLEQFAKVYEDKGDHEKAAALRAGGAGIVDDLLKQQFTPIKVGEGESVYMPGQTTPLIQGKAKPPAGFRWNEAGTGYEADAGWLSAEKELRAAGRPSTTNNINVKGETKGAEASYEMAAKGWNAATERVRSNTRGENALGNFESAMDSFDPGAGSDLRLRGKQALSAIGFPTEGTAQGEVMQSAQRQIELANTPKGEGAITENERGLIREANNLMGATPQGAKLLIAATRQLNDYDRRVAQVYTESARKNGGVVNPLDVADGIEKLGPALSPDLQGQLRAGSRGKALGQPEATATGDAVSRRPAPAAGPNNMSSLPGVAGPSRAVTTDVDRPSGLPMPGASGGVGMEISREPANALPISKSTGTVDGLRLKSGSVYDVPGAGPLRWDGKAFRPVTGRSNQ